jgi:predicted DNA-binding transcriptional regulator AlpA
MDVQGKPWAIEPAKTTDGRTGMTPAQRWREEKAGRFPKRIQITPWRIGYYSAEIDDWIASRPRGGAVMATPRSPGRPRGRA